MYLFCVFFLLWGFLLCVAFSPWKTFPFRQTFLLVGHNYYDIQYSNLTSSSSFLLLSLHHFTFPTPKFLLSCLEILYLPASWRGGWKPKRKQKRNQRRSQLLSNCRRWWETTSGHWWGRDWSKCELVHEIRNFEVISKHAIYPKRICQMKTSKKRITR